MRCAEASSAEGGPSGTRRRRRIAKSACDGADPAGPAPGAIVEWLTASRLRPTSPLLQPRAARPTPIRHDHSHSARLTAVATGDNSDTDPPQEPVEQDRKSTRLNSSHL